MKKIFLTLLTSLCVIHVFAQNPDVLGYYGASYSLVKHVPSGGKTTNMNGIALGGDIYKNLIDGLYADFGLNLQVIFKSEKEDGVKMSTFTVPMTVPLGLAYKINLGSDNIFLLPNAGFDIGAHLGGSMSIGSEHKDLFKDLKYNRFIFNWHAGINLCISKVSIIFKYEGNITPYYNQSDRKIRLNQWVFGLAFDI